ncbi:hypothetical protein [Methanoplanus limicola]|uniref:hypothetical protein n=1 Tax=Methanoplanus limicola TaxID=2315 RepID=UPI00064F26C8|nr:hypothetical protein [Methanoplanus limicola]
MENNQQTGKNQHMINNQKTIENKTGKSGESIKTMKKMQITSAILLIPLITAGTAPAYIINFKMPSAVQSGETPAISKTGPLPAGFTTGIKILHKGPGRQQKGCNSSLHNSEQLACGLLK